MNWIAGSDNEKESKTPRERKGFKSCKKKNEQQDQTTVYSKTTPSSHDHSNDSSWKANIKKNTDISMRGM